jgi:hypothetical protein
MILLQTAIELLARRLDAQATSSNRADHKSAPSHRAASEPFEVGITLEALKVMMAQAV